MGPGEEDDNLACSNILAASNSLGLVSLALVVSLLIVSGVPGIIFIPEFPLGGSTIG